MEPSSFIHKIDLHANHMDGIFKPNLYFLDLFKKYILSLIMALKSILEGYNQRPWYRTSIRAIHNNLDRLSYCQGSQKD